MPCRVLFFLSSSTFSIKSDFVVPVCTVDVCVCACVAVVVLCFHKTVVIVLPFEMENFSFSWAVFTELSLEFREILIDFAIFSVSFLHHCMCNFILSSGNSDEFGAMEIQVPYLLIYLMLHQPKSDDPIKKLHQHGKNITMKWWWWCTACMHPHKHIHIFIKSLSAVKRQRWRYWQIDVRLIAWETRQRCDSISAWQVHSTIY